MNVEEIKDVLRIARTKDDIDYILLNIEDFHDILDTGMFNRIDAVTQRSLQELGLYGHVDGFSIYCSKECPIGQFALGDDLYRHQDGVQPIHTVKWTKYALYFPKHQ